MLVLDRAEERTKLATREKCGRKSRTDRTPECLGRVASSFGVNVKARC